MPHLKWLPLIFGIELHWKHGSARSDSANNEKKKIRWKRNYDEQFGEQTHGQTYLCVGRCPVNSDLEVNRPKSPALTRQEDRESGNEVPEVTSETEALRGDRKEKKQYEDRTKSIKRNVAKRCCCDESDTAARGPPEGLN